MFDAEVGGVHRTGSTRLTLEKRLEAPRVLDVDDPRWEVRLPDPLIGGRWFCSQPQTTRSRYCLARICAGMAIGIAMETTLSVALNRYLDYQPLDRGERGQIGTELEDESRHSEMFGRFISRVNDSWPGLPEVQLDPQLIGLAWERWLEAAVRKPELLFMLVLCVEEPITTLQTWYLEGQAAHQHPVLGALYQAHLGDEVGHVSYAEEALGRRLRVVGRERRNRLRYLAPVAAMRAARHLIWPPASLVEAFRVPDAALADPQAVRAGEELVSLALSPLITRFRALEVISERTAPLWQSITARAQADTPGSQWQRGRTGASRDD
jgi:P-aminobenzoate N-oxygenase AurF